MLFIGGLSRSGTTLVQGLLSNSPNTIGMTAEASYFRALMESYRQTKMLGYWNHAKDYFKDFQEFYIFHQNIVQSYINHVRDLHPTGYQVHKEPRLLKVWPELCDFWPKAFYIIVIRDPRDIVASQIRRMEGQPFDLPSWFSEQMMNLQIAMSGRQENIFVRYEDLVTEPRATLEELAQKLQIEIPLDTWEVKRQDDSCSPLDGKLPEPSSIGRHKEVLAEKTIREIETLRDWFKQQTSLEWFYDE